MVARIGQAARHGPWNGGKAQMLRSSTERHKTLILTRESSGFSKKTNGGRTGEINTVCRCSGSVPDFWEFGAPTLVLCPKYHFYAGDHNPNEKITE